jgi:hypothetical protein
MLTNSLASVKRPDTVIRGEIGFVLVNQAELISVGGFWES